MTPIRSQARMTATSWADWAAWAACAAWLLAAVSLIPAAALAQTSSRDTAANGPAPAATTVRGVPSPLAPAIERHSLIAVAPPEPRLFAVHDLVTIVIREELRNDHSSTLETEKEYDLEAGITEFPDLRLSKLLQFALEGSNVGENPPTVRIESSNEFEGQGDYSRRDTVTGRITGQIIDIKPNGTLVLEARKFIKSDAEELKMVLTGRCRNEDITADNTVLSTQIYDMHLVKETSGELRRTTKKGWLTRLFEGMFNF